MLATLFYLSLTLWLLVVFVYLENLKSRLEGVRFFTATPSAALCLLNLTSPVQKPFPYPRFCWNRSQFLQLGESVSSFNVHHLSNI